MGPFELIGILLDGFFSSIAIICVARFFIQNKRGSAHYDGSVYKLKPSPLVLIVALLLLCAGIGGLFGVVSPVRALSFIFAGIVLVYFACKCVQWDSTSLCVPNIIGVEKKIRWSDVTEIEEVTFPRLYSVVSKKETLVINGYFGGKKDFFNG